MNVIKTYDGTAVYTNVIDNGETGVFFLPRIQRSLKSHRKIFVSRVRYEVLAHCHVPSHSCSLFQIHSKQGAVAWPEQASPED